MEAYPFLFKAQEPAEMARFLVDLNGQERLQFLDRALGAVNERVPHCLMPLINSGRAKEAVEVFQALNAADRRVLVVTCPPDDRRVLLAGLGGVADRMAMTDPLVYGYYADHDRARLAQYMYDKDTLATFLAGLNGREQTALLHNWATNAAPQDPPAFVAGLVRLNETIRSRYATWAHEQAASAAYMVQRPRRGGGQ